MPRAIGEGRRERARRLYAAGGDSAAIAAQLGVTPRTVQRWCEDIARPRGARPNPAVTDERVIEMHDAEGLSFAEIASLTALASWESARNRYRTAKGLPRYPSRRQQDDGAGDAQPIG